MNRILVVGTTGAGKSTIAAAIAQKLGIPHIELDALFWEPNWTMADTEVFRDRVATATSGDRWVADGNYLSRLENRLWERADTVVWPDPPLWRIVPRLVRRTVSRAIRDDDLWDSGNKESLRNLLKKESLVIWAFRTQREHQRTYGKRMADAAWSHVTIVRLRSRRQVREWLAGLRADG